MKTYLRDVLRRYLFLLVACFLIVGNGFSAESTAWGAVNGSVRQIGNQQVLSLWGSNYEMGYAHGYLLADKIRDLIDHYMINTVTGSVSNYNTLVAKAIDVKQFQWKNLDEINGMEAGMAASGKSLYVASIRRNINSSDIKALNLQEEFYFGCSSFGVWGNATVNRETIVARNLDFYWDPEGNNANYQMVIAYEPTGKTRFISFAWPGSVGVYSGMNENGVTMMANTGNLVNPYGGPFQPVSEVYRTILETTATNNFYYQPLNVITSVHENPPEIIQVGTLYQSSGDPIYCIEQSHDLDVIRYSADNGYDHIIATNHFMSVPATPSSESLNRYNAIRNGLISLYGSGDGKVNSSEARNILRSVANSVAPTLTSIVIRPNTMDFDLSFAKVVNGVFTAATSIAPQTYTWVSLFPDHVLTAMNDSYSTTANITLNQAAPGVLGNDIGSSGATLTAQLVSGPSHGALALNSNGSFAYAPAANYAGSDSFTYRANDGTNSSNVATVTITVTQTVALSSLTINPVSVTGGATSTGTVTLTAPAPYGGVVVALSDNSSATGVPSTVTVASGNTSATFTIATTSVSSNTSVTIFAVYAGVTKTATLTVAASSVVSLSSLSLNPTSVRGGSSSQGTVILSGPAPSGGVVVSLSDNSSAASVPASVTVASGSTSASFTITTTRVSSTRSVTISARYGGVTKTAVLTVRHR